MRRLHVMIPSRSQPEQASFLKRAIQSVCVQTARESVSIEVLIGLDPGARLPDIGVFDVPVRAANAAHGSQAAALNATAALLDADYVAILEDDDRWQPTHLATSLRCLEHAGFVSGTQLEIDVAGRIVRINDFPTPSGWVMSRDTWARVGEFNPEYRCHLDNEWLGRLGSSPIDRVHLAEATSPADVAMAARIRPWLANVVVYGGGRVRLLRHVSPVPLIVRLVHTGSGMHQIETEPARRQASQTEIRQLTARFGRVPW